MNFSQMHERLRVELLRRIERRTLSISLLARQTGLGKSHISGFLHCRRGLSNGAADRILAAQRMDCEGLSELGSHPRGAAKEQDFRKVPVVSHHAALDEPFIRPQAIQMSLHLPDDALHSIRSKSVASRRKWERFVAIRILHSDALPMDPLLLPDALAVIDRHYNTLTPYRPGRPNLYAVRAGAHLALRFVDFAEERLVLRPLNMSSPVDLIDIGPEVSLSDYIAGRVVLTFNWL
jgi:hypothetical protein